jgi:hypothetical protein
MVLHAQETDLVRVGFGFDLRARLLCFVLRRGSLSFLAQTVSTLLLRCLLAELLFFCSCLPTWHRRTHGVSFALHLCRSAGCSRCWWCSPSISVSRFKPLSLARCRHLRAMIAHGGGVVRPV